MLPLIKIDIELSQKPRNCRLNTSFRTQFKCCYVLTWVFLVQSVQFPVSNQWKHNVLDESFQWFDSRSSPTYLETVACLFYRSGYPPSKTHWQLRVCRHILPRATCYLLNFLLFWMPRLWSGIWISTFLQFLFTVLMLLWLNMDFRTLFLEEMISLHPLQNNFLSLTIKFSPGNCLTRSYNGTFVVSLFPLRL